MQVSAEQEEQGEAEEPLRMDRRVLGLWQEGEKFGNGSAGERASHGVSQCPFQSSTERGRGSAVTQVRCQGSSIMSVLIAGEVFPVKVLCLAAPEFALVHESLFI